MLNELRKDYILDRWVIVATERRKRPWEFKQEFKKQEEKQCFFCPGNEHLTPPETYRIGTKDKWLVRAFPNKFPAVDIKENTKLKTKNQFFLYSGAYGYHEILVDSYNHKKQLSDFPVDHIKKVLQAYVDRIRFMQDDKKIKYVSVFKNHSKEAAASIVHSHTQIISYTQEPHEVLREIKAISKYKSCPYCKIINIERKSKRKAYENKTIVAFTPYASRFHYELWIFPKRHVKSIIEVNDEELLELAKILKKALLKLKSINAPFNYIIHNTIDRKNYHFHIEILPRLNIFGGFEFATGCYINAISPEEAAKFYKK